MNENDVIEGMASMYWHIAKRSPAASGLLRQCSFAASICSGSRWPPGSLVMTSVAMPERKAAIQITRWLNGLVLPCAVH